jgi:hypothetical protein
MKDKKLEIFVFTCDYNEVDYLDLQIRSYKENFHIEGTTSFNVINGSIRDKNLINSICVNHDINCSDYDFSFSKDHPSLGHVFGYYSWLRKYIESSNDHILAIHPDMFFLKRFNFSELLGEKMLYFVPRYHENLFYIWEGILLIDCEKMNNQEYTKDFDLSGIHSNGAGNGDGGSTSHLLMERMDKECYGFLEFWNLGNFENDIFDTHLNGHVRYKFNPDLMELIRLENGLELKGPKLGNRSFPYEDPNEKYTEYYIENFLWIKSRFMDNRNIPDPVNFDIICKQGEPKNPFILHLKSGSGYQAYHSNSYKLKKIDALKKIILNEK